MASLNSFTPNLNPDILEDHRLPSHYSRHFCQLLDWIMEFMPAKRPTVNELLSLPILKDKVVGIVNSDRFK